MTNFNSVPAYNDATPAERTEWMNAAVLFAINLTKPVQCGICGRTIVGSRFTDREWSGHKYQVPIFDCACGQSFGNWITEMVEAYELHSIVLKQLGEATKNLQTALNENMCDVCAGTGKVAAPEGCVCGGSGKASDAFQTMRRDYHHQQWCAQIARDALKDLGDGIADVINYDGLKHDGDALTAAVRDRVKELRQMVDYAGGLSDQLKIARELLWAAWSNGLGYGDDGEMQWDCIDFKRMPMQEIQEIIFRRNMSQWAGPEFRWTVAWENLMKEKSALRNLSAK